MRIGEKVRLLEDQAVTDDGHVQGVLVLGESSSE